MDLGALGTKREPVDITFNWFGTTIRAHPFISDTIGTDFLERAEGITLPDELKDIEIAKATPEQMQIIGEAMATATKMTKGLVREVIHPEDFDTYWRIGREQGQLMEDHMAVVKALTEAVGKERGQQSSDSATTTGPESPEDFVRRVTAGRPDLEVGLMDDLARRREQRAS